MRIFSLFPFLISLVPPLFLSETLLPQVLNMKVAGTLKYEGPTRHYKSDCVYEGGLGGFQGNRFPSYVTSSALDSFLHVCCYISRF